MDMWPYWMFEENIKLVNEIVEEEEEEFNEEIEMAVSIDDNDYNDDVVAVNNIEDLEMQNND